MIYMSVMMSLWQECVATSLKNCSLTESDSIFSLVHWEKKESQYIEWDQIKRKLTFPGSFIMFICIDLRPPKLQHILWHDLFRSMCGKKYEFLQCHQNDSLHCLLNIPSIFFCYLYMGSVRGRRRNINISTIKQQLRGPPYTEAMAAHFSHRNQVWLTDFLLANS